MTQNTVCMMLMLSSIVDELNGAIHECNDSQRMRLSYERSGKRHIPTSDPAHVRCCESLC
eukprot:2026404-Amphidinium_carterae.2